MHDGGGGDDSADHQQQWKQEKEASCLCVRVSDPLYMMLPVCA